jgi:hypothetical protein
MPRHQRQLAARRVGHYNRTLVRATEEQPRIRLASLVRRCQGVGPLPAKLSCLSERFPRQQIVTIRALWEVCPKHRNVHREIPWPRQCNAGVKVFVLCCVEGRSTGQAIECRTWWHCVPAPQFPCVRSSAAERRVANAEVRVRLPPSAPIPNLRRAPARAVESPKLDEVGAAPTRRASLGTHVP